MHQDGISVTLELTDGTKVIEYAHTREREDDDALRAIVSIEHGIEFEIKFKVDRDFKPFSSEGLKVVVACGHTRQEPWALHDVQAFYISNEDAVGERYYLDCFSLFRHEDVENAMAHSRVSRADEWALFEAPRPKRELALQFRLCDTVLTPFTVYAAEQVHEDWWQESFNADEGCITVFVVRGKLDGETDTEREKYATDPPEVYRRVSRVSFPCVIEADKHGAIGPKSKVFVPYNVSGSSS